MSCENFESHLSKLAKRLNFRKKSLASSHQSFRGSGSSHFDEWLLAKILWASSSCTSQPQDVIGEQLPVFWGFGTVHAPGTATYPLMSRSHLQKGTFRIRSGIVLSRLPLIIIVLGEFGKPDFTRWTCRISSPNVGKKASNFWSPVHGSVWKKSSFLGGRNEFRPGAPLWFQSPALESVVMQRGDWQKSGNA